MNFDTYKIKDELLEIYSGSEETFCVGKILSKNRDSILFRSYDAQGKKKQSYQRNKIKHTVFKKNAVIFSILERTGGCTFN